MTLSPHQRLYLAVHLCASRKIDKRNQPESYDTPSNEVVVNSIYSDLLRCSTSDELYEYCETFANITDPMFDLFLSSLMYSSSLEEKVRELENQIMEDDE